jgi:hypothetical protein
LNFKAFGISYIHNCTLPIDDESHHISGKSKYPSLVIHTLLSETLEYGKMYVLELREITMNVVNYIHGIHLGPIS